MTSTTIVRPPDLALRAALRLAATVALVRLLLQFALTLWSTHLGYGYFRDEFYYIACGRHLAWGYVDHGPLVAVQARLGELLFGDSIFAIRILSAVAGAAAVFLTGILTWALGGRRPAQMLALLCVLLAPGYIGIDGYLSMNSCEAMFWMTSALALVLLAQGRSPGLWWTIFGLSSGLGLLNKPSMTFFLAALGIGLLCTPQRRILFTHYAALGIALMTLLALPNVLWQVHNHWPTLEFLRNGQIEGKNVVLSPLQFVLAQILQLHPVTALVWIAGIVALLRARSIRDARWIGIAYIVFVPIMWKLHAKDYYLEPFYPVLFAAGAIAWEHRFARSRNVAANRTFAFPVLESVIVLLVLLAFPMAAPILKPDTWVRYATAMHFQPKPTENERTSILPQFYADRFGWNEIVSKMVAAYDSLPAADRAQACLVGGNYGEAGALDFLGPRFDPHLPPAISAHNNYWIWGQHGCTRKVVIVISDGTPADFAQWYDSVQVAGHIDEPLAMPYEHKNIYILRNRKEPLDWSKEKHFL